MVPGVHASRHGEACCLKPKLQWPTLLEFGHKSMQQRRNGRPCSFCFHAHVMTKGQVMHVQACKLTCQLQICKSLCIQICVARLFLGCCRNLYSVDQVRSTGEGRGVKKQPKPWHGGYTASTQRAIANACILHTTVAATQCYTCHARMIQGMVAGTVSAQVMPCVQRLPAGVGLGPW